MVTFSSSDCRGPGLWLPLRLGFLCREHCGITEEEG